MSGNAEICANIEELLKRYPEAHGHMIDTIDLKSLLVECKRLREALEDTALHGSKAPNGPEGGCLVVVQRAKQALAGGEL